MLGAQSPSSSSEAEDTGEGAFSPTASPGPDRRWSPPSTPTPPRELELWEEDGIYDAADLIMGFATSRSSDDTWAPGCCAADCARPSTPSIGNRSLASQGPGRSQLRKDTRPFGQDSFGRRSPGLGEAGNPGPQDVVIMSCNELVQ